MFTQNTKSRDKALKGTSYKQFNGPCRTTKGEAMGNIRTTKGMGNLLARAHTG